jgi:type IV pilus biogenesis protein CpaD/CtpE
MSRKVSIMFKSLTQKLSRKAAPVLLLLALPLAGCAADQWAADEAPLVPYGGSKMHPIKVVGNTASVEGCGEWSVDGTDTYENSMSPNHGCAVQANIAAMAAYPKDLVKLRRMSRPPAGSRVMAVKAISAPGAAASTANTPLAAAP